jgi:hypothetical protein
LWVVAANAGHRHSADEASTRLRGPAKQPGLALQAVRRALSLGLSVLRRLAQSIPAGKRKPLTLVSIDQTSFSPTMYSVLPFLPPNVTLTGSQAHIVVTSPSGRQTGALAQVRSVSPSLFTLSGTGTGEVAALDAINFSAGLFHVASGVRYVALFGTGIRNS